MRSTVYATLRSKDISLYISKLIKEESAIIYDICMLLTTGKENLNLSKQLLYRIVLTSKENNINKVFKSSWKCVSTNI
jgi:hypothetical protein